MRILNKKFAKLAKKHKVALIGQVTGANGKHMNEAINLTASNYIPREAQTLNLSHIEENGLSSVDIGKVIQFDH